MSKGKTNEEYYWKEMYLREVTKNGKLQQDNDKVNDYCDELETANYRLMQAIGAVDRVSYIPVAKPKTDEELSDEQIAAFTSGF